MTDRSPHTVRCDDDLWREFTSWIEEKEGQKHGEIGRHVEYALEEYINADRGHRVEKNQEEMKEQLDDVLALLSEDEGTHTHKTKSEWSESDVVTEIHREIVNNHDGAVKDEAVERVIIEVADLPVGDPRTLRRYKENLRQRGLLYEHPGEPPIWTDDREMWVRWANKKTASRADLETICGPYPAQVHENGSGLQIEFTEADE